MNCNSGCGCGCGFGNCCLDDNTLMIIILVAIYLLYRNIAGEMCGCERPRCGGCEPECPCGC
ncbi:MAG: hypothetical protein VB100_11865 [Angelakisella sp.]|nr:hypothetical protein [Angelakisella sp.]